MSSVPDVAKTARVNKVKMRETDLFLTNGHDDLRSRNFKQETKQADLQ
jgi:hypothetical protein